MIYLVIAMKIRNSLKSLLKRHRDTRLVRRKGRIYIINNRVFHCCCYAARKTMTTLPGLPPPHSAFSLKKHRCLAVIIW